MKRVVIVLPQLWTGGIQKMNLELAAHIHDPRVEVCILSLYPRCGEMFEKQADDRGIHVEYLSKRPGVDLTIIWKVYRFFRKHKPDVIHINQRMTTYVLLPMLLCGIQKRIYVVHSLAERDARGLARKVNRFAFHYLKVEPIAISKTCRASIAHVYGLPEDKIRIIHNGVNLDLFKRETAYQLLPENECVFITSCAFREVKNLPLMVKAFAITHLRCPATRLIMLGDGETMEDVKHAIAEHQIEDCVQLTGSVNNVAEWLQKAHVYVLSSDWEGIPVSVLEAMSVGLPVVATKAGGVPDIVKDGVNGLLANVGDCEALAQAMQRLATDCDLRLAFSKASQRISEQYGMEQCVESYIRVYTE